MTSSGGIGMSHGLNLDDLEHTSREEIDAHLLDAWSARQPLYTLYATSLMTDYAPKFAKLSRWGSDLYAGDAANVLMLAVQNMLSYMIQGWETGIRNTFHTLHRNGLTKAQIMEDRAVLATVRWHARAGARLSCGRRLAAGHGRAETCAGVSSRLGTRSRTRSTAASTSRRAT